MDSTGRLRIDPDTTRVITFEKHYVTTTNTAPSVGFGLVEYLTNVEIKLSV